MGIGGGLTPPGSAHPLTGMKIVTLAAENVIFLQKNGEKCNPFALCAKTRNPLRPRSAFAIDPSP